MKIAFVDEFYLSEESGGAEIWTIQQSKAVKKNGIGYKIYSYHDGISIKIPKIIRNFPYIREAVIFPYIGFKLIPKIEQEYDIINFASISTPAIRKANVRTVMTVNCLFSRQTKIFQKELPLRYSFFFNFLTYAFYKQLEIRSLNNVDYLIVGREAIKKFMINELSQRAEKIFVLSPGTDIELFRPNKDKNKKEKIVLFVGRGTIAKGFDVVLKASDSIEGNVVVVAQRIANYYMKIAKSKKNITILSRLNHEELAKLYQRANVFILPSLAETGGPPLTTLEAMASGLPVVCTIEGGGGKIVDNKNGFIVPNRDPKFLSEKVNILLKDENIAHKFGFENRKIVEENYSSSIINSKIINMFESII